MLLDIHFREQDLHKMVPFTCTKSVMRDYVDNTALIEPEKYTLKFSYNSNYVKQFCALESVIEDTSWYKSTLQYDWSTVLFQPSNKEISNNYKTVILMHSKDNVRVAYERLVTPVALAQQLTLNLYGKTINTPYIPKWFELYNKHWSTITFTNSQQKLSIFSSRFYLEYVDSMLIGLLY